jgi:hypothetical protein
MITLNLTSEQVQNLKSLLVTLMSNQVQTNAQTIVSVNQACLGILGEIAKAETPTKAETPRAIPHKMPVKKA